MSEIIWETPTTNSYSIIETFKDANNSKDIVDFYPSPTFQGSKNGYVFTTGTKGTGYYIDL